MNRKREFKSHILELKAVVLTWSRRTDLEYEIRQLRVFKEMIKKGKAISQDDRNIYHVSKNMGKSIRTLIFIVQVLFIAISNQSTGPQAPKRL